MNNPIWDEIGLDIVSSKGLFWLTETDKDFWNLLNTFGAEEVLPDDWHQRVENGEMFECDLDGGRIVSCNS